MIRLVPALGLCLLAGAATAGDDDIDRWFDAQGKPSARAQDAVARAGLPRLIEGAPFALPERESLLRGTGCVTVQFLIRKDGLTDKFVVLDSKSTVGSPEGLDETVLRSLKFWKFEPPPAPRAAILPIAFVGKQELGTRISRQPPVCELPAIRITGHTLPAADRGALPFYPPDLVRAGAQGCVTLVFKVQANGLADDYAAYDAAPTDAFVATAAQALNDWRFDGVPAGKQVLMRFEFLLPGKDGKPPACRWPPKVPNLADGAKAPA